MNPFYDEFLVYLNREDRGKALELVLEKLSRNEIDTVSLYRDVLTRSLIEMDCSEPEEVCIYKEHVRSSIIRTILENCYPYVLKEREKEIGNGKGEKVIVLCPPEELHEIGPRMVADFFTILGYDVTFIGANTPKRSFLAAVSRIKPRYVAISVSNYYNLIATKRTIDELRKVISHETRIIVGGGAFSENQDAYKEIGADVLLSTFEDIHKLAGGD
jgi:methanogenic corrinoid protein MtbC1